LNEIPAIELTGDGGLRMTADDLYTWTQVIVNRELLSEESWNEILNGGKNGYGFGIEVVGKHWEHGGGTWGFLSSEYVNAEKNVVIITLSNKIDSRTGATMNRIIGYAL